MKLTPADSRAFKAALRKRASDLLEQFGDKEAKSPWEHKRGSQKK